MNKKGIISIVVLSILFTLDFIADKIYESGKVIFDTKMALLQMNNSDVGYLNYNIYNHNNIYYGFMFFVNFIVILILIIKLIESKEQK
jgi:hypothetical protein